VWWCTPIISSPWRLKKGNCEFKVSLGYTGRSCLKKEGKEEGGGSEGGRGRGGRRRRSYPEKARYYMILTVYHPGKGKTVDILKRSLLVRS
jgi:hypothetical protein